MPRRCVLLARSSRPWFCESKNGAPGLNRISNLNSPFGPGLNQHVNPRTELDESHALAPGQLIARTLPEYDATRQSASNLLHVNSPLLAFNGEGVLLVLN